MITCHCVFFTGSPTTGAQINLASLRNNSLTNQDVPLDSHGDSRLRNSCMSLDEKTRTMSRSGSFRDGFEEGEKCWTLEMLHWVQYIHILQHFSVVNHLDLIFPLLCILGLPYPQMINPMPYNLTKTKYLRRQHDVVAYRLEVYASGARQLELHVEKHSQTSESSISPSSTLSLFTHYTKPTISVLAVTDIESFWIIIVYITLCYILSLFFSLFLLSPNLPFAHLPFVSLFYKMIDKAAKDS